MFENDDELKKMLNKDKPQPEPDQQWAPSPKDKEELFKMLNDKDVEFGVIKLDAENFKNAPAGLLEALAHVVMSATGVNPELLNGESKSYNTDDLEDDLNDLKDSVLTLSDKEFTEKEMIHVSDSNPYYKPYFDFIKLIYNNTPYDINHVAHMGASALLRSTYMELVEDIDKEDIQKVNPDLSDAIKNTLTFIADFKEASSLKDLDNFFVFTHILSAALQIILTSAIMEDSDSE